MAQAERENIVAGVNSVLHVTNEMSETNLVFRFRKAHLGAVRSDTQKSGRKSPKKSSTTFLPRDGSTTKTALSSRWNSHQCRLPTRRPVLAQKPHNQVQERLMTAIARR